MTTTLTDAERAWREGDTATAIEAADRVLAAGTDQDCVAASIAAAAAAADGALVDAAARWRVVAGSLNGAPGVAACGRAALASALVGDVPAAVEDLARARERLSGAAPRGLTVLLDGVEAVLDAVRGNHDRAARRLAGLATAAVPVDVLAASHWDDLVVTVLVAGGCDRTASEVLASYQDRPATPRRLLLSAWLHLRAGRLADARAAVAAAGASPVLRRDAVLAAAVTVGLARRAGDADALRSTWRRVAPVVAGADVEVLLLDAWGELSAAAAAVSRWDQDTVVEAMAHAVSRAGSPAWCVAGDQWWQVQRAVVVDDAALAASAASGFTGGEPRASAARAWASVLGSAVDPGFVASAARVLADAGQPWEAMALCGAAASRLSDAAAGRELLGVGRGLRARIEVAPTSGSSDGLSVRERAVGELLVDGLTHKEIGARLYISPKTVEQHVAKIRQKLVASSRAELIASLRARLA